MAGFEELLRAPADHLLQLIYRASTECRRDAADRHAREMARVLNLSLGQLTCAVGFNARIHELPDVVNLLGFEDHGALTQLRNRYFTHDVYTRLGIKNILALYTHIAGNPELEKILQHLLQPRLETIETLIEATVNPLIIERYKKEIRALYGSGLAHPPFAETRLQQAPSGFRALLSEVMLIVENRIIPVGDIFFRDAILPAEKRRLIERGLVPRALVEARLEHPDLAPREQHMLAEQLRLMAHDERPTGAV